MIHVVIKGTVAIPIKFKTAVKFANRTENARLTETVSKDIVVQATSVVHVIRVLITGTSRAVGGLRSMQKSVARVRARSLEGASAIVRGASGSKACVLVVVNRLGGGGRSGPLSGDTGESRGASNKDQEDVRKKEREEASVQVWCPAHRFFAASFLSFFKNLFKTFFASCAAFGSALSNAPRAASFAKSTSASVSRRLSLICSGYRSCAASV